jgi:hypothetical protein
LATIPPPSDAQQKLNEFFDFKEIFCKDKQPLPIDNNMQNGA